MNKLAIFNREVIPVYNTDTGEKIVIGRELHQNLKIIERYSKWFERMSRYGFEINVDYTPYQKVHPQNNQQIEDHYVKLDMAKHIAMIQRTPEGKAIRDKLITLETTVSNLSPQLQLLINMELKQKELETRQEQTEKRLDDIKEIVALNPNAWRTESKRIISKIAQCIGGNEYIRDIHKEIYDLVDKRGGVSLSRRLDNLKGRLSLDGASKTKLNNTNKVDVIAADKKLIEIYIAIIKEMAVKYGISVDSEELSA